MDPKQLDGSLKVAILIQSLGRRMAEEILEGFSESEKDLIQSRLSHLDEISGDIKEKVAREFMEATASNYENRPGSRAAAGTAAYGFSSNFESLNMRDPDDLAELIRNEHPQTIAVILVHLRPDVAGAVLSRLSEDIRTQVAVRIASANKFDFEMVEEVNRVFEDILREKQAPASKEIGGLDCLADILNQMDSATSQDILEGIEDDDPLMVVEVKRRMFVFDDLILIDDRGFQQVLRRVGTRELAVALKGASEEVKEKTFRNMSERAGDILKEEMEVLGPIRMKEVEDTQQLILKIIQDMEVEGELSVRRGFGEQFVE